MRKRTKLINKDGGKHRRILCETDMWFRNEKIFKWSGCHESVKETFREQTSAQREHCNSLNFSTIYFKSVKQNTQMYMTHYCSYEGMSNWAGSWRGERRTEHLTLLDSCLSVSAILEGNPWEVFGCRSPVPSPPSVSSRLAARELAGLLTRQRGSLSSHRCSSSFLGQDRSTAPRRLTGKTFLPSARPSLGGALRLTSTGCRALLGTAGPARAAGRAGPGLGSGARDTSGHLRPLPGGTDPIPAIPRHGKGAALASCPRLSSRLTPAEASPRCKLAHLSYKKKQL